MSGTTQSKTDQRKPLTAADAAGLVKIKPSEVLDFKEYADRVVVVTTDGQKLEAAI